MTETVEHQAEDEHVERSEPCVCESFARWLQRAALAAARWLGRDDQQAAEEAATAGMARTLAELPIQGRVVIGAEEGSLAHGTVVGRGDRPYDLALDPLEGRSIVARGGHGAMSMIAVGESGSLVTLPDMYMRRWRLASCARKDRHQRPDGREHRGDRRGVRTASTTSRRLSSTGRGTTT
jgi:hypothetical protein